MGASFASKVSPARGAALGSMGDIAGKVDMESPISVELSRGEVENRDVGGACLDRNPHVSDEDDLGDSESPDKRYFVEPELTAVVSAMARAIGSGRSLA